MKTFWALLRKVLKMTSKSITFLSQTWCDSAPSEKATFPMGKQHCTTMTKGSCENLTNTVVYEDFWRNFAKRLQNPHRKALGFSVKPDAIPRHRQKQIFLWEDSIAKNGKRELRKPYKHCRLWRLLESFCGNWQNHPKSIMFLSQTWCAFATSAKVTFPMGNSILQHRKISKKP